jgi:hypothetical protein
MLRPITLLLVLAFALGTSGTFAQTKKPASVTKPTFKDSSITINIFMRDANKNELLLGTRLWPNFPDYNAIALQRFFAMMKALEPGYKQDDEVAYTWATKGRVTKGSIYLESWEAGVKNGTGTIVGCEANGVSSIAVTSTTDPNHAASSSESPQHLNDVMDLFKKQWERARNSVAK